MAAIIAMELHKTALAIFCVFFLFVTVAGFWAARWRRPEAGLHSLEEWGLAGRSFGTWISWFLIGGDLYTAYTVVAVPALLFGSGAFGFFAVPYAVIAYPYMMVVLPRLWKVCHRHGYVTFADFLFAAATTIGGSQSPLPSPASSHSCPTSRCNSSACVWCSKLSASPAKSP